MRLSKILASAGISVALACAASGQEMQHHHPAGDVEQLGRVDFAISCNPAVQKEFNRAVAMMHSFWYEEAGESFAAVAEKDPACAMAHWGLAMSYYHPIWEAPDAATLKKGQAAVDQAKSLGAKTRRERDYIAAIETYYKDSDKLDPRTRALAYEKAMDQLRLRYPKDSEATVFYGLSLLGTALPGDKSYANQKHAGEILEKVFARQPEHPGVVHYIIHAYDYPELASRALVAARKYAKIAPSAPHALHMPSHIFTRLGYWHESAESNRASAAAARAYAAKHHPEAASFEDLHAMDYLEYAYLQGGQDLKAKRILEQTLAVQKTEPANFAAAYALAAVPARYFIERRRWSEAATLTAHPEGFPWNRFPWAEAIVHFARGLGAARSGDAAAAQKQVEKLQSLRDALLTAKQNYWADQVEIQRRTVAAWLAHAEGKNEQAVELMHAAVALEDSTEKHPVTPGPIVPARELLGDLLLELQQPAQALREFETALLASPNRFNSLYGAARAAEFSGEAAKAKSFYAKLTAICDQADGERAELEAAKSSLANRQK